jgi:hypothetical protein
MTGLSATFANAVALHLSAAGRVDAAAGRLDALSRAGVDPASVTAERGLAQRLSAAAQGLRGVPGLVRLGEARLHDSGFPVHVPFMGAAHLAVSADARDPRVAGLVRSLLLQTLSTEKAGSVEVVGVDTAAVGATLAPLHPLVDARLMSPVATDAAGLERALAAAEEHVKTGLLEQRATKLILVIASMDEARPATLSRLAALARSGVGAGLHIIAAGVAELPESVQITVDGDMWVGNPPGVTLGARGGLLAPVAFDPAPDPELLRVECARIAEEAKAAAELRFADLAPAELWREDPSEGVTAIAGKDSRGIVRLSFDDTTPHWLIGGRTGGGKTVFLLNILYGLTAHYSPDDLALYLLDFKEGVSFTEFTPQASDPTFIPHARAVGVESDREYGVAILRELDAEMTRRSVMMKRHGVARYSQLRGAESLPRIVCIVDEFQVLFAGNDSLARQAVAVLENLARKGRSYGVHLVLASQTTSGIEALYNKQESIFGQFPLRVALPGANAVLDVNNNAAAGLRTGEAVINVDGGAAGRERRIRFPNAHADNDTLYQLRHDMWSARGEAAPPTVFYGYAAVHLDDDPRYAALTPNPHPEVLLGRRVNARLDTAAFSLDSTPGRHLSILGADPVGAHLLHAATASLLRQRPSARYLVAALTPDARARATLDLVGFGLDAANLDRAGQAALRRLLREGPGRGVHLLGWWRGLRRFADDIGGSSGREDVAGAVVLNIPGGELIGHFGQSFLDWDPRPGRGLFIDRHANTRELLVPFTSPEEP